MEIALKKFYHLFWNNAACRKIFLLHKELLLEKNTIDLKITDFYLPRIVISNSLKQKKSELKISSRSENIFIETVHKLANSEKKYLSPERLEKYIDKKFGESKAVYLKEYGNEEGSFFRFFGELLDSISDENAVMQFIKKYKLAPEEIEGIEDFIQFAESLVLTELKDFFKKEGVSNLLGSIDDISDVYNSVIKNSLIKANKQVTDKLFDDENFSDRVDVFENLYEIGVLTGGYFKSYIECTNCLPKTFSGFITCDIAPRKLKFKCPNCKNETYYMVPYQIHRELYDHIIEPDGVLANSIAFLLDHLKLKYERNINFEGGNEIDFVVKENGNVNSFIEVKMFRNDRTKDVKIGNILKAVSQIKKTKDKLIIKNEEYKDVEYLLVTNIIDEEIYLEAEQKCKADLEEYNIFLLSPDKFSKSI